MTEPFLEGDWLVIEIDGEPVDPDAPRAVRFEGDRVSGRVGVNRFTGSFTIEGDVVRLGPVSLTRMMGPPERMALENRFNSAFQGDLPIELAEVELVVGERAIVLERVPAVSVRGTVSYRERIGLPPDSVVMVDLVDISIADVALEPIATQAIAGTTGPPFPFSLESTEDIDESHMLAVSGSILSAEGNLLWATDTPAVLTDRAEQAELILRRVG